MNKIVGNALLVIISISISLVFAELASQIYVYHIAKRGKMFIPDPVTGWSTKPNLNIERKLPGDDHAWAINTNKKGFRKDVKWDSSSKKILIIGDSFAFGHGVNIEDRFDSIITTDGYSILNTGVTGYGTDQQFLKAKPYLTYLAAEDIVIVLTTTFNDFNDISKKQHGGRAKPWYELDNEKLKFHEPKITAKEILRDKSYIYAKLSKFLFKQHIISDDDISRATNIYKKIIENESKNLTSKGVHIILAYFGIPVIKDEKHRNQIAKAMKTTCLNNKIHCLNIDEYFDMKSAKHNYLSDGHWNKIGNKAVAELLTEKISYLSEIKHNIECICMYDKPPINETVF